MDPNSGVRPQPASEDAIAALPPKRSVEVMEPERQGESCVICRDQFEAYIIEVELPCGHVFHENGCIVEWSGVVTHQYPNCKAKLPVAKEEAQMQGGEVVDRAGKDECRVRT